MARTSRKNAPEADVIDELDQPTPDQQDKLEDERFRDLANRINASKSRIIETGQATAEELRNAWRDYGKLLNEARGELGPKEYGQFVKKNGLDDFGTYKTDRAVRVAATHLANLTDEAFQYISERNPSVYNPRTIMLKWREEQGELIELLYQWSKEGDLEDAHINLVGKMNEEEKAEVQKSAQSVRKRAEQLLNSEIKAQPNNPELVRYKRILTVARPADLAMALAQYEPKAEPVRFVDLPVDAAAVKMLKALDKHPEAYAVFEAMQRKVKDEGWFSVADPDDAADDEEDDAADDTETEAEDNRPLESNADRGSDAEDGEDYEEDEE